MRPSSSFRRGGVLPLVALVLLGATPLAAQAPVAVVVNRSNPQNNLTLPDLRDLYLGALTRFKAGERVVLVEDPGTRPRFYNTVLQMNEARVKRHWIGLVFSGEGVVPPREIRISEELVRYVASHPGAIGFVTLQAADSTVKIMAIDGALPTDARYPIR